MEEKNLALQAIRKKLVGKRLSYKEIYAVMDQISQDKLGDILTTYFVASGYSKGFSDEELFYLTKAMVETGDRLHFGGIVADKHSIGGTPGTRATLIIVPIIAAAGFKIPKSSSRAITTPAGTADAMEVLAKVTFNQKQIYEIVEKTNACIVWGGSFKIAPADDEIIKIEEPLLFESFDKILVSVMAKKVAFGSTHVIIDLPYGRTVKLHSHEDAELLGNKFLELAKRFDIKMEILIRHAQQPAGNGIGPLLEARDALKVLEQTKDRPFELEDRALDLTAVLLKLCLNDLSEDKRRVIEKKYQSTREWAEDILKSGLAHEKMKEIIKAQKGNPKIAAHALIPASKEKKVKAARSGKIRSISNINITIIAKLLGAPQVKDAGIFLHKRIGNRIEKGEDLFVLYAEKDYNLKEAIDSLDLFPIYEID